MKAALSALGVAGLRFLGGPFERIDDRDQAWLQHLFGGDGHDWLRLEVAGKGILDGDGGDDILSVDPAIADVKAIIYGGPGSDSIIGGASRELAFGGRGDDYVAGGDDDVHGARREP